MKNIIILLFGLLFLPISSNAQHFNFFDIDESDYPTMRAKFYSIDADGNQILDHTTNDFEITENGEQREVISVSCPDPLPRPMSVCIMVDTYSYINLSRHGAERFVNFLDMPTNELGITAMDRGPQIVQDFTDKKVETREACVNIPGAPGGTRVEDMFFAPMTGGIPFIKERDSQKKILILISDLHCPNLSLDEQRLYQEARDNDIKIYTVLLRTTDYSGLFKRIADNTNGEVFENVTDSTNIENIFLDILYREQNDPCEILWQSKIKCSEIASLEIINKKNDLKHTDSYYIDESQTVKLIIEPSFINFGNIEPGSQKDTTIRITSENLDRELYGFEFSDGVNVFRVKENFPIPLEKGIPKEITIEFNPLDSNLCFSKYQFLSSACSQSVSFFGGFINKPLTNRTLRVKHPNGNEVFHVGSDTLISWEGISETDTVLVELSINKGQSWEKLKNISTNNLREWNIPYLTSPNCLIRVSQFTENYSETLGSIEWEKSYGGSENDVGYSIKQTYDDGYIIIGYTESSDNYVFKNRGEKDFWIIKLNKVGDMQWEKSYGGTLDDVAYSIDLCFDGGFIIAGYTKSSNYDVSKVGYRESFWIIKVNEVGELEWEKSFGGTRTDMAHSVKQTNDGGYIVVGETTNSTSGKDILVLKLKDNGELEWQNTYGGSNTDQGNSIIETFDGNFIIAGFSRSNDFDVKNPKSNGDFWVLKINQNGDLLWEKSFGGDNIEKAVDVKETFDNGYIVAGFTQSANGDISNPIGKYDYWVIKLDYDGNLEWEKSIGGKDSEYLKSISITNDNGIILSGQSNSMDINKNNNSENSDTDFFIVKLDYNGNLEWQKFLGSNNNMDIASDIIQTLDNGFILTGFSESKNSFDRNTLGLNDIWVIKLSEQTLLQSDVSDSVFSIIAPQPRLQNNDIDMGQMVVGSLKDTMVVDILCNDGEAPLHVLGVDITSGDDGDFLIPRGAGEFTLKEDECQNFMFEFIPTELGTRTAYATIRTTIGDFQDTITITGEGIQSRLEVQTDLVDFGAHELGDSKDTNVVLIKNIGPDPITVNNTYVIGPDFEQFEVTDSELSFTILPGETNELDLRYTARYGGRTSSILAFEYDGVDSPLRAQLFAEGIGGEVYPEIEDAYAGEVRNLNLMLGRIKPEGIAEIANSFTATIKFNSTLLAPVDKSMFLEIDEDMNTVMEVEGNLTDNTLLTSIPVKAGLGVATKTPVIISDFQLYNANGDSVFYDIEPGIGEFNLLGICEEGGTRLINPNGQVSLNQPTPNITSSQTEISFETIESGHTRLEVYNMMGNQVATIINGSIEPGKREITLDLSNFPSGRYYIKLTTPTVTKTEKFQVVR